MVGSSEQNFKSAWKKKRWWMAFLVAAYLCSYFVPWSRSGPAMSCWTAAHEIESDRAAAKYAEDNGHDPGMIISYLHNSGFRIRNFNNRQNELRIVFSNRNIDSICTLLDLISIDGSLTILRFADGGGGLNKLKIEGED